MAFLGLGASVVNPGGFGVAPFGLVNSVAAPGLAAPLGLGVGFAAPAFGAPSLPIHSSVIAPGGLNLGGPMLNSTIAVQPSLVQQSIVGLEQVPVGFELNYLGTRRIL